MKYEIFFPTFFEFFSALLLCHRECHNVILLFLKLFLLKVQIHQQQLYLTHLIVKFLWSFISLLTIFQIQWHLTVNFFTACSELWKVLFLVPSVCGFLFVYEISPELPNGYVPNSDGRCFVPCADEFKGQGQGPGHQGQKTAFFGPSSGLCAVHVWYNIFSR